jgi:GDP-mannose 6-dehydrogenase
VAILGLSFKAGTDDLRESPVINLIHQLWQDGLEIMVYDADIQDLSTILASNREYLERQLPQIHQIFHRDLDAVLERADAIVMSQVRPEFDAALQSVNGEKPVLNLMNWKAIPATRKADRSVEAAAPVAVG